MQKLQQEWTWGWAKVSSPHITCACLTSISQPRGHLGAMSHESRDCTALPDTCSRGTCQSQMSLSCSMCVRTRGPARVHFMLALSVQVCMQLFYWNRLAFVSKPWGECMNVWARSLALFLWHENGTGPLNATNQILEELEYRCILS